MHRLDGFRCHDIHSKFHKDWLGAIKDRLCGLVVRILGYRSGGSGSISGATTFSEK
jgi:hypothetical protein